MRVLLIGAASGIGAATARLFAERGHDLFLGDRDEAGLGAVVDSLARPEACAGTGVLDATDSAAVATTASAATRALGGLDCLVSTVGWTETHDFVDEEPGYWRAVIEANLMSNVLLTHAVLDPLRAAGGGSIVLTASEAGKVGTVGETLYAASKAGLIGFVKSVAREVARFGIRVNATAPGPTETPLLRAQADQDRVVDRTIRAIPLRRISTPEEQATAIHFLACEDASFVTGQTLSVGGGLAMNS